MKFAASSLILFAILAQTQARNWLDELVDHIYDKEGVSKSTCTFEVKDLPGCYLDFDQAKGKIVMTTNKFNWAVTQWPVNGEKKAIRLQNLPTGSTPSQCVNHDAKNLKLSECRYFMLNELEGWEMIDLNGGKALRAVNKDGKPITSAAGKELYLQSPAQPQPNADNSFTIAESSDKTTIFIVR